MGHSTFYQRRSGPAKSLPITYLLLESIQASVTADPEVSTLEALSHAATLCFTRKLTQDEISTLAVELQRISAEEAAKDKPQEKGKEQTTLGSTYMAWLGKLPADKLCYLISGFDPAKAEQLYCEVDHRTVSEMAASYIEQQWQLVQVSYEASMYGFGGGYKNDKSAASWSGENTNTFDLTKGGSEAIAALKSVGF